MRKSILWLAVALMLALLVGEGSVAQSPGKKGKGKGKGSSVDRIVANLDLTGDKKEKATAAIRAYQENVQRLTDLASASLMLKLKDLVSQEEFTKLRKSTEKARAVATRGPGGFGGRGRGAGRDLGASDMVERIMSFDKNKDGKITKDELPERMQYLIAKGDTNKDGALDKDEIKKLAADLARDESGRRRGPGGAQVTPAGRLTPSAIEQAVGKLELSESKKEPVKAAIKACRENVTKLKELARADLQMRVTDVVSEEDMKKFTTAVDKLPSGSDSGFQGRRPPQRGRGR